MCFLTRLSAFVIKCFHQAKDYIAVDDGKIAQTLRWILANQEKNGLFVEPHGGRVIHKDMQVSVWFSREFSSLRVLSECSSKTLG